MKRYSILALALVLGCTIFTGCRRGNGDMMTMPSMTQAATERPTNSVTQPATEPSRPAATEPSTQASTGDATTGSTGEATENMTQDGQSRSRGMDPGWK